VGSKVVGKLESRRAAREIEQDRQVAVLRPEDWAAWLYLTRPEPELLRPLPAGALEVTTVRPGSD